MLPSLVVFDLAGTTIQDQGHVSRAFTAALNRHQIVITNEQLIQVRGTSKRQAILRLIPDRPDRIRFAEIVYQSFSEDLATLFQTEGVKSIPGARQVFESLRTQGIKVALNTGFDREITQLLLTALSWNKAVADAIVCGDDVKQGRPAPDMIFRAMELVDAKRAVEVANVGDTISDLRAGHNAGVGWNIGVLSGAHDRKLLEREPHTHLIPSVAELVPLVFVELQKRKFGS
jgi:phosphonatase-like hydrolase